MRLRALTKMSLRKSPDSDEWHRWKAGEVFEAPAHMNVKRAIKRGIAEDADKAPAKRKRSVTNG